MVKITQPIWGTKAENDLKEIYGFYSDENEDYAKRIIESIVKNAEALFLQNNFKKMKFSVFHTEDFL